MAAVEPVTLTRAGVLQVPRGGGRGGGGPAAGRGGQRAGRRAEPLVRVDGGRLPHYHTHWKREDIARTSEAHQQYNSLLRYGRNL